MTDVFISYSRSDREVAKVFADAFAAQGWSVWWDPEILVGTQYDKTIEDELDRAKCVVVLWSKRSVESRWVRSEASKAVERSALVPVRIGADAEVPLEFTKIQTADLAGWDGDRENPTFAGLVRGIERAIGGEPRHPPVVAGRPAVSRAKPRTFARLALVAAPTVAALVLAGIAMTIHRPTAFDLDLTVTKLSFVSAAQQGAELVGKTPFAALQLHGIERGTIEAKEAALVQHVGDATEVAPMSTATPLALPIKISERKPKGASVTFASPGNAAEVAGELDRLFLSPGDRAELEITQENRPALSVHIPHQPARIVLSTRGEVIVEVVDATIDTANRNLLEGAAMTLRLDAGDGSFSEMLATGEGPTVLLWPTSELRPPVSLVSNLPVSVLDFQTQGPTGAAVTTLSGDGTIGFAQAGGRGRIDVKQGHYLVLHDLKTFFIRKAAVSTRGEGHSPRGWWHGRLAQVRPCGRCSRTYSDLVRLDLAAAAVGAFVQLGGLAVSNDACRIQTHEGVAAVTLKRYLSVVILLLILAAPWLALGQIAGTKVGVVKIVTAPGSKTGTGIVVRRDHDEAWIVTAMHVVSDADEISVQFPGADKGWKALARNIEFDNPAQGLALLRVAGSLPAEVVALPLATDSAISAGEEVTIIGHQPSTGDWGVLTGTVSGLRGRELVIQAPIQEQTSGGPVIVEGRVIGLVQRRDPSGQFGYAVTAQAIKEYLAGNQVSVVAAPTTPARPAEAKPPPIAPPPARAPQQPAALASVLTSASAEALRAVLDKGKKSDLHWPLFLSDEGGRDLLERSVLLAVESVRRTNSAEGQDALRRGLGFLVRPSHVLDHGYPVRAVALSASGEHLATASDDGTARVWETASGREIVRVSHGEPACSLAFSPDGMLLATSSKGDIGAAIWHTRTGREMHRLEHTSIEDLAFSRDGSLLATASLNGKSAIVWDVATGKEVSRLVHDRPVEGVMFSRDAQHVFTRFDSSYRGPVFVWESRTGKLVQKLGQDDDRPVQDFALSPDGTRLAIASLEKVRVYTVGQWNTVTTAASRAVIHAVAFSPDGAKLAVGAEWSVAIMSPSTGELKRLGEGGDTTRFVAFSRDARYVLSLHQDRTARVWETDGGRELMRIPTYQFAHNSHAPAAFSADGRLVISIGYDSVKYWPLPPEEFLVEEACRRLTRNLTQAEWKELLPDERYRKTCPSLP